MPADDGVGFDEDFRGPTGRRLRVHDIRHTLAVHALLRWSERGMDPQAKLPFLSA